MRRPAKIILSTLLAFLLVAVAVVVLTVVTPITEQQVREWFDAVGGVLSAAAAIVVALIGFQAQREQAREAAEQQRLQGMEAAEAARRAAEESMAHARQLEQERFESQSRLERERDARTRELADQMSLTQARRSSYGDVLGWAFELVSGREPYNSARTYGEALATASDEVRQAIQEFADADEHTRRARYDRLVTLIRAELGSESAASDE